MIHIFATGLPARTHNNTASWVIVHRLNYIPKDLDLKWIINNKQILTSKMIRAFLFTTCIKLQLALFLRLHFYRSDDPTNSVLSKHWRRVGSHPDSSQSHQAHLTMSQWARFFEVWLGPTSPGSFLVVFCFRNERFALFYHSGTHQVRSKTLRARDAEGGAAGGVSRVSQSDVVYILISACVHWRRHCARAEEDIQFEI